MVHYQNQAQEYAIKFGQYLAELIKVKDQLAIRLSLTDLLEVIEQNKNHFIASVKESLNAKSKTRMEFLGVKLV